MSTAAHLLVLAVALVAIVHVFRLLRRRELRSKYALLWTAIAVVLLPVAVVPAILERLADALGIGYAPSAFFLAAIGVLFFIVVHYSWELSRLERRIRDLAEEVALLRADLPSQGEDE